MRRILAAAEDRNMITSKRSTDHAQFRPIGGSGMDATLLATAILSGPDAIIAADRDAVITFWNAGAERIFGFTEAHAVGQSLDLIIPERLRARHWAGWRQVMASGHS